MKFRKVFVRNKQDESSNKNKKYSSSKEHIILKAYFNKTLLTAYYNMLDGINLFDKMIICNKRPKNIRDIIIPSLLKFIEGKNPSNVIQEISHHG